MERSKGVPGPAGWSELPPELELRQSSITTGEIGLWCKKSISSGRVYGPFLGQTVFVKPTRVIDCTIWQIRDNITRRVLHYLDASKPGRQNWMRHLKCSPFIVQKNVEPVQKGLQIYYKVIKDLSAGEELITYLDGSPLRIENETQEQQSVSDGASTSWNPVLLIRRVANNNGSGHKKHKSAVTHQVEFKSAPPNPGLPAALSLTASDQRRSSGQAEAAEDPKSNDLAPVELMVQEVLATKINVNDMVFEQSRRQHEKRSILKKIVPTRGAAIKTPTLRVQQAPASTQTLVHNKNNKKGTGVKGGKKVGGQASTSSAPPASPPCPPSPPAVDQETGEYQFHVKDRHIIESNRHGKKVYQCDICAGVYRHAFSLKRHFIRTHINYNYLSSADIANCNINMTNHAQKRPVPTEVKTPGGGKKKEWRCADLYRCHLCQRYFGSVLDLQNHIANHPDSPAQKRFACGECEMTFSHKQNLVRHESVHSGVKPHTCRYCHKSFPSVANQRRHERIHEGLKPYDCRDCDSCFSQSGDLRKHVRKQHRDRYHPCNLCPKYFPTRDNLAQHAKAHQNREEVGICDTNFAFSHQFPASSSTITLGTSNASNNGNHDTGQAGKYQTTECTCTECPKKFSTYVNMCRHRRLAHHLTLGRGGKYLGASGGNGSNGLGNGRDRTGTGNAGPAVAADTPINEKEFLLTVAQRISDNLINYVDGKAFQLKYRPKKPSSAIFPSKAPSWKAYNFPETFELSADNYSNSGGNSQSPSSPLRPPPNGFAQNMIRDSYKVLQEFGLRIDDSCYDSYDTWTSGSSDLGNTSDEDQSGDEPLRIGRDDVPVSYVCSACGESYDSFVAIDEHKINNHPNVYCTHVEIEGGDKYVPPELSVQYCSPVGALRQCAVPPLTAEPDPDKKLLCTKCESAFESVPDLHLHILECGGDADFVRQNTKFNATYSRRRGRPVKRLDTTEVPVKAKEPKLDTITVTISDSPGLPEDSDKDKAKKDAIKSTVVKKGKDNGKGKEVTVTKSGVKKDISPRSKENLARTAKEISPRAAAKIHEFSEKLTIIRDKYIKMEELSLTIPELMDGFELCEGCNLSFRSGDEFDDHAKVCSALKRIRQEVNDSDCNLAPAIDEAAALVATTALATSVMASSPVSVIPKNTCPQCLKQFSTPSNVKKHIKEVCSKKLGMVSPKETSLVNPLSANQMVMVGVTETQLSSLAKLDPVGKTNPFIQEETVVEDDEDDPEDVSSDDSSCKSVKRSLCGSAKKSKGKVEKGRTGKKILKVKVGAPRMLAKRMMESQIKTEKVEEKASSAEVRTLNLVAVIDGVALNAIPSVKMTTENNSPTELNPTGEERSKVAANIPSTNVWSKLASQMEPQAISPLSIRVDQPSTSTKSQKLCPASSVISPATTGPLETPQPYLILNPLNYGKSTHQDVPVPVSTPSPAPVSKDLKEDNPEDEDMDDDVPLASLKTQKKEEIRAPVPSTSTAATGPKASESTNRTTTADGDKVAETLERASVSTSDAQTVSSNPLPHTVVVKKEKRGESFEGDNAPEKDPDDPVDPKKEADAEDDYNSPDGRRKRTAKRVVKVEMDESQFRPHQLHMCPHCLRKFSYLANYRKHIWEGCPLLRKGKGARRQENYTVGVSSQVLKGQIEDLVIDLLREQSRQSDIMKQAASPKAGATKSARITPKTKTRVEMATDKKTPEMSKPATARMKTTPKHKPESPDDAGKKFSESAKPKESLPKANKVDNADTSMSETATKTSKSSTPKAKTKSTPSKILLKPSKPSVNGNKSETKVASSTQKTKTELDKIQTKKEAVVSNEEPSPSPLASSSSEVGASTDSNATSSSPTGTTTTPASKFISFSCNFCHKIFLSYWKLLQHRISHKLEKGGYQQPDGATLSTEDALINDFNKLSEKLRSQAASPAAATPSTSTIRTNIALNLKSSAEEEDPDDPKSAPTISKKKPSSRNATAKSKNSTKAISSSPILKKEVLSPAPKSADEVHPSKSQAVEKQDLNTNIDNEKEVHEKDKDEDLECPVKSQDESKKSTQVSVSKDLQESLASKEKTTLSVTQMDVIDNVSVEMEEGNSVLTEQTRSTKSLDDFSQSDDSLPSTSHKLDHDNLSIPLFITDPEIFGIIHDGPPGTSTSSNDTNRLKELPQKSSTTDNPSIKKAPRDSSPSKQPELSPRGKTRQSVNKHTVVEMANKLKISLARTSTPKVKLESSTAAVGGEPVKLVKKVEETLEEKTCSKCERVFACRLNKERHYRVAHMKKKPKRLTFKRIYIKRREKLMKSLKAAGSLVIKTEEVQASSAKITDTSQTTDSVTVQVTDNEVATVSEIESQSEMGR